MPKAKEIKTNVMRILDQAKIPYQPHYYAHSGDEAVDGVTVAALLGQNPDQAFKTLVTRGASREYYVFVIPVAKELNLKAAAKSVGEKAVEMLHVNELLGVTGYIRGGCSPIGMKKHFGTIIDESCLAQESMMVSAGKIGTQVELAPKDLIALTGAKTAAVATALTAE